MGDANRESSKDPKMALLIVNKNYQQSANKIHDSDENINELKGLLEKANFKVMLEKNLTEAELTTKMKTFSDAVIKQSHAIVLVYYFGHVCYVNETNYLIPIDDNTGNEGTGLIAMTPPNRVFIQFACDSKQTMKDASEIYGYGLFTKHLLKNLLRERTDIVKVFKHISDDVYKEISQIPYDATWSKVGLTIVDRLSNPKGLCMKNNEALLIADTLRHRVLKLHLNKGKIQVVIGTGVSGYSGEQLCRPSDVVFENSSASDIISDTSNYRMIYCRPETADNTGPEFKTMSCAGIAMDDEGSLYVCDRNRHEVRRYKAGDLYGTVVAGGNGQGSRLQQLNYPTYVAVGLDQGVYVSDSHNNRIMKWVKGAKKGVIVAGGHGKGKSKNQLDYPTGIVVDQSDTLYIADYWNNRVMRWYKDASQGEIIVGDRFLFGNDKKHLNGPEDLTFDQEGNIYITDSNNNRIQKFNSNQD